MLRSPFQSSARSGPPSCTATSHARSPPSRLPLAPRWRRRRGGCGRRGPGGWPAAGAGPDEELPRGKRRSSFRSGAGFWAVCRAATASTSSVSSRPCSRRAYMASQCAPCSRRRRPRRPSSRATAPLPGRRPAGRETRRRPRRAACGALLHRHGWHPARPARPRSATPSVPHAAAALRRRALEAGPHGGRVLEVELQVLALARRRPRATRKSSKDRSESVAGGCAITGCPCGSTRGCPTRCCAPTGPTALLRAALQHEWPSPLRAF